MIALTNNSPQEACPPVGPATLPRERLAYMDAFRAMAIVQVIAAHVYGLGLDGSPVSPMTLTVLSLFSGATALFVFISGFLFQIVNAARFDYGPYVIGKWRTVFVPALAWIFVIGLLGLAFAPERAAAVPGVGPTTGLVDLLSDAFLYAVSDTPMWYIPYLAVIVVLGPVFALTGRLGPREKALALLAALALGLVINRPVNGAPGVQNFAYFLFYLLFGIFAAQERGWLLPRLARADAIWASGLAAAALAWLQAFAHGHTMHAGAPFEPMGINFQYLQKVAQTCFFLGLFSRYSGRVGARTKMLAGVSFGLFFLHYPWIMLLERGAVDLRVDGWPLLSVLISTAVVFALSFASVLGLRKGLGKRSKWLVGA
ncbi:Acyltransferase family protein [Tsuneonella dongtanensis]|uniref:Acyltransferase family protein n=1 Tax=Tsuneonella dongtanensis TaxID=692370 RepID=A0A1B2AGU2_9SPHN|nr:acyltransferase [Tsuneonella dongtanensis]ANY21362.1 Acyltransferase family protein [Tsuneonella dongtanensis]